MTLGRPEAGGAALRAGLIVIGPAVTERQWVGLTEKCGAQPEMNWSRFLRRDAMRKRDLRRRSVSVCLSVTFVYCIHTAEDIVEVLSQPGSPAHHSGFLTPCAATQFQGESLQRGVKIHRGWGKLRSSTEIAVYLYWCRPINLLWSLTCLLDYSRGCTNSYDLWRRPWIGFTCYGAIEIIVLLLLSNSVS